MTSFYFPNPASNWSHPWFKQLGSPGSISIPKTFLIKNAGQVFILVLKAKSLHKFLNLKVSSM